MSLAISPGVKKTLSGLAVAAAAGVLAQAVHDLPALVALVPPYAQALAASAAVGAIAGVAHVLDAWGHTDRVEAAVAAAKTEPPAAGAP